MLAIVGQLEKVIGPDSWVPLGSLVAILVVAITITWKMRGMLSQFESQNKAMFGELASSIESLVNAVQRLSTRQDNYVSQYAMQLWIERFRRRNPTMDVPDPHEPPRSSTPSQLDESA